MLSLSRIARRIILVILLILSIGIIAEVYFRYFYIATDNVGITLSSKKLIKKYCQYNSEGFMDAEQLLKLMKCQLETLK